MSRAALCACLANTLLARETRCTVYSNVRPGRSHRLSARLRVHPQVFHAPLPHRGPRAHGSRGVCAGSAWHGHQAGRATAAHRRAQALRRGRRASPAKAARQLRLKRRGLPWPRLGFPAGWSRAGGAALLASECSGATGCSQSLGACRGATPLTYTSLLLNVMKGENSPIPTPLCFKPQQARREGLSACTVERAGPAGFRRERD